MLETKEALQEAYDATEEFLKVTPKRDWWSIFRLKLMRWHLSQALITLDKIDKLKASMIAKSKTRGR